MANVVYILGAGASKDFGFPLGSEIFSYGEGYSQLDSEAGRGLSGILPVVTEIMEILFPGLSKDRDKYPAFEEVLTFLWDCCRLQNVDDREFYNHLFKKYGKPDNVFNSFVKFLGLTLLLATESLQCTRNVSLLNEFVEGIDYRNNTVSFIDFNYDTLLDDALENSRSKGIIEEYTYGIPLHNVNDEFEYSNPFKTKTIRSEGIQLLKPHGSLNLFFCPHKQANYGDGYYMASRELGEFWLTEGKCPSCHGRLRPLVIPPLYNKREYIDANAHNTGGRINFRATPEHFRSILEYSLEDILTKAEQFVIIGYSLPPYDFDFKNILIDGLIKNPGKLGMTSKIITKGKEEARRLLAIFGNLIPKANIESDDGFLLYLKSMGKLL